MKDKVPSSSVGARAAQLNRYPCRDLLANLAPDQMTIPKKGRRSIHVDGDDFHWAVQFERSGHVIIQHASGKGSFVIVEPLDIMHPSHVADAVRYAMKVGWCPGKSGSNIWLGFQIHEPSLRQIPANTQITYNNESKQWVLPDSLNDDAIR